MYGQMSVSKKNIVEEFIKNNDPYTKNSPLQFDLRAYTSYIEKHNLDAKQITPEILKKFKKQFLLTCEKDPRPGPFC